jgi:thiosulfate/3-mercaptopyruvate sulfurtransferase
VDARSEARFTGSVAEPRAGVRSGSIKNSLNVPFNILVDSETGMMKSDDELRSIFNQQGVDLTKPIINSCGSGVTACVLELGQQLAGKADAVVYDGSWSEYGSIDEPDFAKK